MGITYCTSKNTQRLIKCKNTNWEFDKQYNMIVNYINTIKRNNTEDCNIDEIEFKFRDKHDSFLDKEFIDKLEKYFNSINAEFNYCYTGKNTVEVRVSYLHKIK